MPVKNIYKDIPKNIQKELFDIIVQNKNIKIERIISKGQSSDPNFWYDQTENEWVIVLQGSAKLKFQNSNSLIDLSKGDYINIPAHTKHRVECTDKDQETIWLAIFYPSGERSKAARPTSQSGE